MTDYYTSILDNTKLPLSVIEIIVDYTYQLEHHLRFLSTLNIIKKIEYNINNECSTIVVKYDNISKSYYFKFCKICKEFYRTNTIILIGEKKGMFTYSHFNSFIFNNSGNDYIYKNIHRVKRRNGIDITNSVIDKYHCKYISCRCYMPILFN